MKLKNLIKELERVKEQYGDIEVQLQDNPKTPNEPIMGYEVIFTVPEEYEGKTVLNIRSWPY